MTPWGSAQDGELVWDATAQSLVLGSYFWGYIGTQLVGGRLAELVSAKWVLWTCVFIQVRTAPIAKGNKHLLEGIYL